MKSYRVVHTERLLLVPLGPQYLISTHEYASDYENTKYMVNLPNADIGNKSCNKGTESQKNRCTLR